ncbi:MAG: phosphoribosylanthranilate isomerase [Bacteroidota bacterium]
MKYPENIKSVAVLQPDYLGFIFYERSKRNFEGEIPHISDKIKKTGVFVDTSIEIIIKKVNKYRLKAIQLHGEESVEFCRKLREELKDVTIEIIKVFSIGDTFDFSVLKIYEDVCDYFLFDTKGKEKGGNGITFNWELLKNYPNQKPYFLSGGIGLEEVKDIKEFFKTEASKYCYALDINSKFEDEPGLKNIKDLKLFIKDLKLKI